MMGIAACCVAYYHSSEKAVTTGTLLDTSNPFLQIGSQALHEKKRRRVAFGGAGSKPPATYHIQVSRVYDDILQRRASGSFH
jgi:hypothetical protein